MEAVKSFITLAPSLMFAIKVRTYPALLSDVLLSFQGLPGDKPSSLFCPSVRNKKKRLLTLLQVEKNPEPIYEEIPAEVVAVPPSRFQRR
jgi:hypothetical protein